MGIVSVESNLIWRYFLSILKQRTSITKIRHKRIEDMKVLFQKLKDKDQKALTEGKRRIIWDLYEKLSYKNTGKSDNPL